MQIKTFLICGILLVGYSKSFSQIGINVKSPKAALHISPNNISPEALIVEGVKEKQEGEAIGYYPLVISESGLVKREKIADLNKSVIIDLKEAVRIPIGGTDGSGGIELNFGKIVLPEDGTYMFSYRFYGTFTKETNLPTFFLSLYKDNAPTPFDIAELAIPAIGFSFRATYSINLSVTGKKGSVIKTKMGASNYNTLLDLGAGGSTTQANKTSLIYWKL